MSFSAVLDVSPVGPSRATAVSNAGMLILNLEVGFDGSRTISPKASGGVSLRHTIPSQPRLGSLYATKDSVSPSSAISMPFLMIVPPRFRTFSFLDCCLVLGTLGFPAAALLGWGDCGDRCDGRGSLLCGLVDAAAAPGVASFGLDDAAAAFVVDLVCLVMMQGAKRDERRKHCRLHATAIICDRTSRLLRSLTYSSRTRRK